LQAQRRRARLAAELRANLHRRKEQARSRRLREVAAGVEERRSEPETIAVPGGRTGEVA
jgi:hypothetical protein